jgi:hypothetical protein
MSCSTIAARGNVASFGLLLIAVVLLAGCTANSTTTRADLTPAVLSKPLTQQRASEECWWETEPGAKSLPLDKRAKVVDKCVEDKMSRAK